MAENSVTLLICVLMIIVTQRTDVSAMGNCDTHNAICNFNGGLQGALQFREKHGFGCNNFGEDEGLYIDIDLEGFDPRGGVTDHNFRVKSFAGSPPNCSGMGSDFGRNARGADLGTFESVNGVVLISNHRLQQGPTLWGENTILGRSVAVTKGRPNAFQQTTPEILGCCIIGMASLQPTPDSGNSPFTPSRLDNPAKNLNSFNNSPPSASTGSFGLGRQIGSSSPFPGAGSPSFGNSAFKSPFNLDNKLSFFDLSVSAGSPNSPFSGSNSGSTFTSPFSSPSAASPDFFDLSRRSGMLSPPAGVPGKGNLYPGTATADNGPSPQPTDNPNQYSGNPNGYPVNQGQFNANQNQNPGQSLQQNSGAFEGLSFPAQNSLFGSNFGNPSFAGSGFKTRNQLGDLFFRGEDKNPAADLLETGLFDSKQGNGNSNGYENFLEVGNSSASDPSSNYYYDDNNDYGDNYYDYPSNDYPQGSNGQTGDNGEVNPTPGYRDNPSLSVGSASGNDQGPYYGDSGNNYDNNNSAYINNSPNGGGNNDVYNNNNNNLYLDENSNNSPNFNTNEVNNRDAYTGNNNNNYNNNQNDQNYDSNSSYSPYSNDPSRTSNEDKASTASGSYNTPAGSDDPYLHGGGNIAGISAVER